MQIPEGFTWKEPNVPEGFTWKTLDTAPTEAPSLAPEDIPPMETMQPLAIEQPSLSEAIAPPTPAMESEMPTDQLVTPSTEPPVDPRIRAAYRRVEEVGMTTQNLYRSVLGIGAFTGTSSVEAYREAQTNYVNKVITNLEGMGLEAPEYHPEDDTFSVTLDGVRTEVDLPVWDMIGEIAATEATNIGLAAGASLVFPAAAAAQAGRVGIMTVAKLTPWAILKLASAGTILGGMAGRGIDISRAEMNGMHDIGLIEKANSIVNAGAIEAVASVAGSTAGASLDLIGTGVYKAYNKVVQQNMPGAVNELMSQAGIDRPMAEAIVAKWETSYGKLDGTTDEKIMQVLPYERSRASLIVNAANSVEPGVGARMAAELNDRATSVIKDSEALAGKDPVSGLTNVKSITLDSLKEYEDTVWTFYNDVKAAGQQFAPNFTFDYEKLGVQTLLENMYSTIQDPRFQDRVFNTIQRIGLVTKGRNFFNLIETREALNSLTGSIKKARPGDVHAFETTMKAIDDAIEAGARKHIPDADSWLDSWKVARDNASNIYDLQENALYKAIHRAGVDEDSFIKLMNKHMKANDDVFPGLVNKLPTNVRSRIDGAIYNKLVDMYTVGAPGENRVIHFPRLAAELKKYSFESKSTKQSVRAVQAMSKLFKTDVLIGQTLNSVAVQKNQAALTDDIVAKFRYTTAAKVFNWLLRFAPGQTGDLNAMVHHLGRILKQPQDTKVIDDFKRALPKDKRIYDEWPDFEQTLSNLRQAQQERTWLEQRFSETFMAAYKNTQLEGRGPQKRLPEGALPGQQPSVLNVTPDGAVYPGEEAFQAGLRAEDMLTQYLSANGMVDTRLLDDTIAKVVRPERYSGMLRNLGNKMQAGDHAGNARILHDMVSQEAKVFADRIYKTTGKTMTQAEAKGIVATKMKEMIKGACE